MLGLTVTYSAIEETSSSLLSVATTTMSPRRSGNCSEAHPTTYLALSSSRHWGPVDGASSAAAGISGGAVAAAAYDVGTSGQ